MTKILFLINTLGGGGAEMVLVNLVNNMDRTKFDITVQTMFGGGVNADRLSSHIRYIEGHDPCPPGIAYIFRMLSAKKLYKHYIGNEHYDVLVAYMHGAPVKVIEGCPDKSVKKFAFIHNGNPESNSCFRFWSSKRDAFAAYSECTGVVGVSDTVTHAFESFTGIRHNTHTVYNTNDCSRIWEMSSEFSPEYSTGINLVTVGRLGSEKGFDRLIDNIVRLRSEGYNLNLTIVGGGSLQKDLSEQITRLNASEFIRMTGFKANPYPYVRNADMFVCSSHTEGLSTAVTEAVILGVPCVSTEVSGAKEILGENDEYGLVVPNSSDGIYDGIKRLLDNPEMLEHYREKASQRAEFFATEKTVKMAESLFLSI